jgi:hypothetical protein
MKKFCFDKDQNKKIKMKILLCQRSKQKNQNEKFCFDKDQNKKNQNENFDLKRSKQNNSKIFF